MKAGVVDHNNATIDIDILARDTWIALKSSLLPFVNLIYTSTELPYD